MGADNNLRVIRYPKFYHISDPPIFDYRKITQQDRQTMRYAQQQQVDSYIKAYQQEHQARRASKTRQDTKQVNLISPAGRAKTAYDTRSKSENPSSRQINFNYFPVDVDIGISDQYKQKKVVDPKTTQISPSNKFLTGDNSRELQSTGNQNKKLSSSGPAEKVPSYQVSEGIMDQESEASNYREAYIGNDDLLKSTLSPNYLAKPTYVFADPQLNIDPKILMQGLSYSLPENHQLTSEGFHPATQSDIEALNSLLGKSPNAQLQGLNELLEQQSAHPVHPVHSVYPGPVPVQISGPSAAVSVQPESLISVGLKSFTPIKEETQDVTNIQDKPNIHVTLPQVDIKSHTSINHQVQIVPEVKSIYEDDDKVSTVNVIKVKRDVANASQSADDYDMYEYDDNENTTEFYYDDVVTDDYLVEFETTTEQPVFDHSVNRRVYKNSHLSKNYLHSIYPVGVKRDSIDKIEYGDKINPKQPNIEDIVGKKEPTNVIVINNSNDNNNKGSNVNLNNNLKTAHSNKVNIKKIPVKQPVKIITKAKKVQTRHRLNRINRKLKKVNGVVHKLKKKHLL